MEITNRSLQNALLDMMKEFHSICEENELTYYVLGGTCLGAVRHAGFIPWDDDMDIGIPRDDYDRLCEIAESVLPEHLALRYYKTTNKSPFHFVKLVNCNTTLVEKNYKEYVEGIYIDVFPLDTIESFCFVNKMRSKAIRFLHAIIRNHYYTGEAKKGIKNVFQKISKRVSVLKVHHLLERLMTKENNNSHNYYCNYLGAWKDREILEKAVFGKPTLYQFEDTMLFGPENADAYLTSLYDDYMTLPPEDKRRCRHDYYFVDLNMPFKDYCRK